MVWDHDYNEEINVIGQGGSLSTTGHSFVAPNEDRRPGQVRDHSSVIVSGRMLFCIHRSAFA
jgi:hypothetical protein